LPNLSGRPLTAEHDHQLLAAPGDRILTSDPDDLARLIAAAAKRAAIVPS
jgi:hypothetical protein